MAHALILWWLALSVLGWLAWPLAERALRRAPGRGYAFARALGLLVLTYVYWLLGMLGILPNSTVALWAVALLLGVGGLALGWRTRTELGTTLRREWRHILTVELLFAAVLLLYALHKAHDPAIDHTEEPMDFAFLNACLRSAQMPPNDPWLAGFPISYYYMGYLTVALLTRLTALPAGVGYNLGLAHTLALAVVGGYGVLYAVLSKPDRSPKTCQVFAVLGGLALGLIGNLEGLFEWPALRRLLGTGFYRWLDVPGLAEAPVGAGGLPAGGWWWWRASRVVSDRNFLGKLSTVITEFPAFSFLLGDLHPHVMALPYVMLALGLAVALYHEAQGHGNSPQRTQRARREEKEYHVYWLSPLILGALGFLNSWDLPAFLGLAWLAYALGRWRGMAAWRGWTRDTLCLAAWLGLGSILLYLPFYRGLQSQAQGLGLAYYAKTSLKHYLLVFGPWLLPILADAWADLRAHVHSVARSKVFLRLWAGVFVLPWLGTLFLGGWGRTLLGLVALGAAGPWLLLLQSGIIAALVVCHWPSPHPQPLSSPNCGRGEGRMPPPLEPPARGRGAPHPPLPGLGEGPTRRSLASGGVRASRAVEQPLDQLFVLAGISLTYLAEFYYLCDLFDTRMNTVFKLSYQAWVLLGLGAALAAHRLWRAGGWRRGAALASGALLCAGLYYPLAAAYTRAGGYRGEATLDGTAFLRAESPAEYGAYVWLEAHARPGDVLAEAAGEEYVAAHNRLSAWTGVPAILGWAGHEAQWRGSDAEARARLPDLDAIYTSPDADAVLAALRKYGVTYLDVGAHEREKYGVDAQRMAWYATFLEPAYAEEEVRLYRVPRP